MRISTIVAFGLVFILAVTACSPPRPVKVIERKTINVREETEKIGGSLIRIVQPGDTVHAIAFSAGINVNQLAAWNQLTDTSKLNVGQRIRLTRPLNYVQPKKSKPKSIKSKSKQPSGNTNTVAKSGSKPISNTSKSTSTNARNQASNKQTSSPTSAWYFPTQGRIISQFASKPDQQGIDIEGKIGQSVNATRGGEVVYVGDGLKGYGNLVIIKHSEQFLSAYAHNSETFVREGEQVKAKQKIAALGFNNDRKSALQFQIRKNGEPVNPIGYLAK